MKIEPVPLSSINTGDHTFIAGYKGGISHVRDSISEIGLINFPVLRIHGETVQVVTGWKRIMAASELGWDSITAKIYEPGELSDEASLKYIYHDNSDRMDDMELAELMVKFRDMLGKDDREMIRDVLPFLGIPPSRKQYDRYLGLESLEYPVKDAYYSQRITIEQCQMLSETTVREKTVLLTRVLDKYKLNVNESRQVIKDIEEIALRDKRDLTELLDGVEETTGEGGKDGIRAELRKMRYPSLSRVEKSYTEALKDLNLPPDVNIVTSPHFEGDHIEIRIRVSTPEGLTKAISRIEAACSEGAVGRLLSIVREGE